tara:strand:- start:75 stop:233 length:159 start_codon:yes stop_codon:yes gene_type:complete
MNVASSIFILIAWFFSIFLPFALTQNSTKIEKELENKDSYYKERKNSHFLKQ